MLVDSIYKYDRLINAYDITNELMYANVIIQLACWYQHILAANQVITTFRTLQSS